MRHRALSPGDSMPHAVFQHVDGSDFATTALGGQYLLLCLAAPGIPGPAFGLSSHLRAAPALRDPSRARLIVVYPQAPCPLAHPDTATALDLFDPGLTASQTFGAAPLGATDTACYRSMLLLFDPMLRLIASTRIRQAQDCQAMLDLLAAQLPPDQCAGRHFQAPVLYLPRVFSPELCADLIQRYQSRNRDLTGVMRVIGGKTVGVADPDFKRRRDCLIDDALVMRRIQLRFRSAVLPELRKAFGFNATRMERYLVGCYSASDTGHFAPHRDNTTPATAHRRFAVSINLNADFDGGAVSFPEYGPEGIKAEAGAAVVFGCGLLHSVGRVTRGARYAFLPFVYDEAAARIRQANQGNAAPLHEKTAPQPGAV